ncbi:hypothetical protein MANY_28920 [Mycolicibacterium anyangense]|uniref:Uncharacterized protein n=1 Tax=Mycolicibacterium anyangense TaxID=1431246 RepID=A0A6N4W9W9_9MYCO|nr:hypothetical protein [Mycolicibacterium anyangense]BBZ77555.1 hypothetical protein MANY_28920 [Mycolicibacterium anyangense]
MDITEGPRPAARPSRPQPTLILLASAGLLCIAATVGSLAASGHLTTESAITGMPTANPNAVAAAAADRKAAEEAANLADLEIQVQRSMQDFFDDPANHRVDLGIKVLKVGLVKSAENQYEGMATMTANGGDPQEITVHVKADDRTMMWETDPGALIPLFR